MLLCFKFVNVSQGFYYGVQKKSKSVLKMRLRSLIPGKKSKIKRKERKDFLYVPLKLLYIHMYMYFYVCILICCSLCWLLKVSTVLPHLGSTPQSQNQWEHQCGLFDTLFNVSHTWPSDGVIATHQQPTLILYNFFI